MTPLLAGAAALAACILLLRSKPAVLYRTVRHAVSLRETGRHGEAAALLLQTIDPDRPQPGIVNLTVETLISAGSYAEALAVPSTFNPITWVDEMNVVLVQINRAEADYNLGRWDAAWNRLSPLDGRAAPFEITRAGLALQRAWILAHTNRPGEALSMWQQADIAGLPHPYRAEHYFTHVAILLGLHQLDDAEETAEVGLDASVRMSSERNALFMLGRVAAAKGQWERAEELCRSAAGHSFRGQGGDGLLLWGDVLSHLGRGSEARDAYRLCVARDPQSESARIAPSRL